MELFDWQIIDWLRIIIQRTDMQTCVQFATIISPFVAVLIAWYTAKKSSEDCSKKIEAIEESTTRQIESIKKLLKLHAEVSTIQLDKELWELRHLWRENSSQLWDALDDTHKILDYQYSDDLVKIQEKNEKTNKLSYRQDFYMKQMDNLKGHIERLEAVKKELGLQ